MTNMKGSMYSFFFFSFFFFFFFPKKTLVKRSVIQTPHNNNLPSIPEKKSIVSSSDSMTPFVEQYRTLKIDRQILQWAHGKRAPPPKGTVRFHTHFHNGLIYMAPCRHSVLLSTTYQGSKFNLTLVDVVRSRSSANANFGVENATPPLCISCF